MIVFPRLFDKSNTHARTHACTHSISERAQLTKTTTFLYIFTDDDNNAKQNRFSTEFMSTVPAILRLQSRLLCASIIGSQMLR